MTKQQIGREEFLKRAWDWKKKYADRITLQQRKLGASCDWTRQRFTMDEGCSKAVNEVFVRLYEKGLIYRGERIINWCPYARPHCPMLRLNMRSRIPTFGTSATPRPTAARA